MAGILRFLAGLARRWRLGRLLDTEAGGEPGQGEKPLGLSRNVDEDELVAAVFCALLRVDQHVDSGAVDELETTEVDHDSPSRARCLPKFSFQTVGRREIDLAADQQCHAIGLVSGDDFQRSRVGSWRGLGSRGRPRPIN